MDYVIAFVFFALFFFCFYKVVFHFKNKKKNNQLLKITEIVFLEKIFKVDPKSLSKKKMLNIVALTNSLIFSIVVTSTMNISNIIIRILVMFVLIVPLNYFSYYLVSIIIKRGKKKNV